MKRILLRACWIGLASYCLLSSIAGPSGIVATRETQAASAAMRKNLDNLVALNTTYAKEWEVLRTNPASTALEARSLGYLAENEIAVRLSVDGATAEPPSAGLRISFEPHSLMAENSIKNITLLISLVSAVLGFASRLNVLSIKKYRHREIRTHVASL
jgi:cell division protein FtsB